MAMNLDMQEWERRQALKLVALQDRHMKIKWYRKVDWIEIAALIGTFVICAGFWLALAQCLHWARQFWGPR
jgi:hypothetical protein